MPSINQNKTILQENYQKFLNETGYGIIVGIEQEFYIYPKQKDLDIYEYLKQVLSPYPFFYLEKEKGHNQFEVQITQTDNPLTMADMVIMLRQILGGHKKDDSPYEISFHAKPQKNEPGSSMQVHINVIDKQGHNLFQKDNEKESPILMQSIAGLLELMPASMQFFAPYEEAYKRHTIDNKESPSTISWGPDNRTVALRIPSVPLTPSARRIEHRVSCADADPYTTIAVIIEGIRYGIINKIENLYPKIFGNAFDTQYNLPILPQTFEEARKIKHSGFDISE